MSATQDLDKANPFIRPGMILADRFEVCDTLGNGGMGTVYRVLDHYQDGKTLALKLLHPYLANDADAFLRFEREIKVASSLSHETIVKTYSIGKLENGQLYLTLEFVDGLSLKQYLTHKNAKSKSNKKIGLPFKTALIILYQLLQGVSYAHKRGVIHRDLKPANVMISSTGRIKIVDFGTAKLLDATKTITATGEVIGTPQYMSPEQVKGEKAGTESDVYCLGIMGFELVTGHAPFTASTLVAIALQHLSEPLPSFDTPLGKVPDWYEKIIRKATAKEPKNRFSSTEEFAQALAEHEPQIANCTNAEVKLKSPSKPKFELQSIGFPLYRKQNVDAQVLVRESEDNSPMAKSATLNPDRPEPNKRFARKFTVGFCTAVLLCAIGFPLLRAGAADSAIEALQNLPGLITVRSDMLLKPELTIKQNPPNKEGRFQSVNHRHLLSPLSIRNGGKPEKVNNASARKLTTSKQVDKPDQRRARLLLSFDRKSLTSDRIVKSNELEMVRWGAALPGVPSLGSDTSVPGLSKEFSLNVIEPTSGRTLKKLEPNQVRILKNELFNSERELVVSGTLASLHSMYLPTGRYKLELVHMGRRMASQTLNYRRLESDNERTPFSTSTPGVNAHSELTPGASAVTIITPPVSSQ